MRLEIGWKNRTGTGGRVDAPPENRTGKGLCMCIAIPGKVLEVNGTLAKVDFRGNIVDVTLGLVDAKPGQYVLVHAGCAIQVMEKSQADEIIDLYRDMEKVLNS